MQLLCCAVIYIFCVSQSQVEVLWRIYYTHTYFESPHLHSQSLKAVSRSFQRGHTCMVYIHTSESHSPCRWQSSVTFRPLVGHCWRAVQRTWCHLQAKFSLAHRETPLCRMRKKKRLNLMNINVHGIDMSSWKIYTDTTQWHAHNTNAHTQNPPPPPHTHITPPTHHTHTVNTPPTPSPTQRNPTHTKVFFDLVTMTCWPIRILAEALRSTNWGKKRNITVIKGQDKDTTN